MKEIRSPFNNEFQRYDFSKPIETQNMNTKQTTKKPKRETDIEYARRMFASMEPKAVTDSGKAPSVVSDLDDSFILVTDSQDIEATLDSIGKLSEIDDVGCLFVEIADGDYSQVYACERSTPYNNALVWKLV